MNNKELLIDFIEYAKSRHVMPILHSNIEPLVDDYLRQQNLQQCNVSGSLPLTKEDVVECIMDAYQRGYEDRDFDIGYGSNRTPCLERLDILIERKSGNDR